MKRQARPSLPVRTARFLRAFAGEPLAHWPFIPLSRRLTGNPAGAKQNLFGGLQLSYHRVFGRREGRGPVDPEVRAGARTLRRTGVFKLEQPIVPAELTAQIQRKFDALAKASDRRHGNAYAIFSMVPISSKMS